jgi:hypothetical protein
MNLFSEMLWEAERFESVFKGNFGMVISYVYSNC